MPYVQVKVVPDNSQDVHDMDTTQGKFILELSLDTLGKDKVQVPVYEGDFVYGVSAGGADYYLPDLAVLEVTQQDAIELLAEAVRLLEDKLNTISESELDSESQVFESHQGLVQRTLHRLRGK